MVNDEILPFAWDVEIKSEDTVASSSECTLVNDGKIVKDSLQCYFSIYHKNGEALRTGSPIKLDCNIDQRGSYKLFDSLRNDPLFVKNPFGTYYLDNKQLRAII